MLPARYSLARPGPDEFPSYAADYITAVPDGDIVAMLASQLTRTLTLFRALPESTGTFRYQADKWSVKDILGHLTDCERVYTYRALRIARGDDTPLVGFDEGAYVVAAHAEWHSFDILLNEFEAVRHATLALFRSCDPEAGLRRGVANGVVWSVRALAYNAAGHVQHHLQVLKERYGVQESIGRSGAF
jgi:hypothetical protein